MPPAGLPWGGPPPLGAPPLGAPPLGAPPLGAPPLVAPANLDASQHMALDIAARQRAWEDFWNEAALDVAYKQEQQKRAAAASQEQECEKAHRQAKAARDAAAAAEANRQAEMEAEEQRDRERRSRKQWRKAQSAWQRDIERQVAVAASKPAEPRPTERETMRGSWLAILKAEHDEANAWDSGLEVASRELEEEEAVLQQKKRWIEDAKRLQEKKRAVQEAAKKGDGPAARVPLQRTYREFPGTHAYSPQQKEDIR